MMEYWIGVCEMAHPIVFMLFALSLFSAVFMPSLDIFEDNKFATIICIVLSLIFALIFIFIPSREALILFFSQD
nr:MAG TPA: hypothetical protein [Caudoviricetes sp.]